MKLLIIFATKFGYKTSQKGLDSAIALNEKEEYQDVLVAFIQVEENDVNRLSNVETKLIKQLKWAARKNGTNSILLHSFSHLSESKAGSEETIRLFNNSEKRLRNSGFEVSQTPFGYFLDLDLQAPGHSLARIFKDI